MSSKDNNRNNSSSNKKSFWEKTKDAWNKGEERAITRAEQRGNPDARSDLAANKNLGTLTCTINSDGSRYILIICE